MSIAVFFRSGVRLEITPELLRDTKCHYRGGLCAQYSWSESGRLKSGIARQFDFGLIQAAFGTNEKR